MRRRTTLFFFFFFHAVRCKVGDLLLLFLDEPAFFPSLFRTSFSFLQLERLDALFFFFPERRIAISARLFFFFFFVLLRRRTAAATAFFFSRNERNEASPFSPLLFQSSRVSGSLNIPHSSARIFTSSFFSQRRVLFPPTTLFF